MTISVIKAPDGQAFTDAVQTELPGTIIDTETGPETITAVWFGNGRERLVIESRADASR